MKSAWILTILLISFFPKLSGQPGIIDNPSALEEAHQSISFTYNFQFREARDIQTRLAVQYPEHPAPVFLDALVLFWENFPLTPGNPASKDFVDMMDEVTALAEIQMESDSLYMEGLFFDLFGRAFKAMFWADNGKSGKVIPDLRKMYAHTMEGFDYKDAFVEFYFSGGLYNYYVEAYPELHPVYKAVTAFMREGNRELGLAQLQYAIDNTTFLKAEALLFMTLIQLNYELDLDKASDYAGQLYTSYPNNTFYRGLYMIILLYQENFEMVKGMMKEKPAGNNTYSLMIDCLTKAFIDEHESGDFDSATSLYNQCIDYSETFGEYGNLYKAIACMGLSRISEEKGNDGLSRKYARMAAKNTNYDYIISGTGDDLQ